MDANDENTWVRQHMVKIVLIAYASAVVISIMLIS